MLQPFLL